MKLIFAKGPALGLRLLISLAVAILLMMFDHRYHHLSQFRTILTALITPIEYAVNLPAQTFSWLDASMASRNSLEDENAELKDRLLILETQLQRLIALEAENAQLRSLLGSTTHAYPRRQVAEVMAVDTDPFQHLVVINKGALDKVYVGQPVLDANGVVGQILHTGPTSSHLLLITDSNHGIPVRINRNGVRAIANGTGHINKLQLQHVPDTTDIVVGDVLVTSGLGKKFPDGYPVATVVKVSHDPGKPFARIEAKPIAQLDKMRQVLLLWPDLPKIDSILNEGSKK